MDKHSSKILRPFSFIISTFLFLPLLIQFHVVADKMYSSCAPFNCGNFINISYPFWNRYTQPNYCGRPEFMLDCQNGLLTMESMSLKFRILDINQSSQVLRMAREDIMVPFEKNLCPKPYINVDIDLHFFNYTSNNEVYTMLFECGPLPYSYYSPSNQYAFEITACLIEGKFYNVYIVRSAELADFADYSVLKCKHNITIHGKNNLFPDNSPVKESVLFGGFEVEWNGVEEDRCHACIKSGGRCGFKRVENTIMCLMKNSVTPKGPSRTWNWKKILCVGGLSTTLATLAIIIYIYFYRCHNDGISTPSRKHSGSLSLQQAELGKS